MIGVALYALAHLYTLLSSDPVIKHTKKCKYCKQRINQKVQLPLFSYNRRVLTVSTVCAMHRVY